MQRPTRVVEYYYSEVLSVSKSTSVESRNKPQDGLDKFTYFQAVKNVQRSMACRIEDGISRLHEASSSSFTPDFLNCPHYLCAVVRQRPMQGRIK